MGKHFKIMFETMEEMINRHASKKLARLSKVNWDGSPIPSKTHIKVPPLNQKCECGAEAVQSYIHSTYCPKH